MKRTEIARIRIPIAVFTPVLAWATGAAFAGVAVPISIREGSLIDGLTAGAFCVLGTLPVILVICLVCALMYSVRIHPDGLSSNEPYAGKREFLTWTDMNSVRGARVLAVPYMKIEGSSGGTLWIPERVFCSPELLAAVQQHAPESRLATWTREHAA
jgi:hypothetical protein